MEAYPNVTHLVLTIAVQNGVIVVQVQIIVIVQNVWTIETKTVRVSLNRFIFSYSPVKINLPKMHDEFCILWRNLSDSNCIEFPEFVGKVRMDRRCGLEFPLPEGGPSQCDPNTENHCCSKWGFCGPDAEHCDCEECVDYKRADVKGALKICQIYDYLIL